VEKDKLWSDLGEMEHLVREGVAYARSMDSGTEAPCRVNLDAFLDSLVFDYQDSGARVERRGSTQATLHPPHALRRVLVNLVDNALKFAGAAELEVGHEGGVTLIRVLDDGPGILRRSSMKCSSRSTGWSRAIAVPAAPAWAWPSPIS
jgi:signal transduction histidine kinase